MDISAEWRTPIIATADGKVVKAGKDRFLGKYVRIRHSRQFSTLYAHLNKAAVKKGARVKRGEMIGYMGNSGRSTGTHVHYSVIKDDAYVNPIDYIWDRFGNSLVKE